MKKLLIVESPAKIKTISKFLDKSFRIISTKGHIKDLPTNSLGVSINKHIEIDYEPIEGKEKTIEDIKKEASKSNEIFIAPDPDREGEIIAWHVQQEIENIFLNKNLIHRISFNEITKQAIEEAILNPGVINLNKVAAQQARRVLDRLVGYQVSPILWRKISKGLSAGRVQSVALKLICDREKDIQNFKKEEYWTIDGLFIIDNTKDTIKSSLTKVKNKAIKITTINEAQEISSKIKEESFKISSIKDSKRTRKSNPPFMTSTLQQEAYNKLGFSVSKTMQLAQKLYEGIELDDKNNPIALITYMRTDSLRISDSAIKQVRNYIKNNLEKEYLPKEPIVYEKAKGSQNAHEAIRPIDINNTPEFVAKYTTKDLALLYELIWKRFIACQIASAKYLQRQVIISSNNFEFKTTGSTLLFDGFLKLYNEIDNDKDIILNIPNAIEVNQPLKLDNLEPKQHFTQPPARYTEASLVKELEKEGIGRPSTYATILKTIQTRAYTSLDNKKRFVPTDLGILVTNILTQNLPHIINVSFTSEMEKDLDKIASGELDRDKLIRDFYNQFEKDLESFKDDGNYKVIEKVDLTCPNCFNNSLLIRIGKSGPFIACSNYPSCKFTSQYKKEDGNIQLIKNKESEILKEKCPQCESNLKILQGKFGQFIGCSGYPNCKYIKPNIASFKCLECLKGDITQKFGKGKKFWGCSNYPNCKFTIPGDIKDKPCTLCLNPYLIKKKKNGEYIFCCTNKKCNYEENDKEKEIIQN